MDYVIIFFSQSGALKFNKTMEKNGVKCTLGPTPRMLSSSCGTCAMISYDKDVKSFVDDEVESIYLVKGLRNYELVYDGHAD